MRSITVEARSLESALGIVDALSEFHPELIGSDEEGYGVLIELGSFDRQVIAVLDALEGYITNRNNGPARVELDGRRYTLHSDQPSGS
jgi:hypothetical protein